MSDVFAELRAAILRGDFAPRQRLIEAELVEQYGTSRFVLRNALTRLVPYCSTSSASMSRCRGAKSPRRIAARSSANTSLTN